MYQRLFFILLLLLISSCAIYQPSNNNNICSIFQGDVDWYEAAANSQKKWGAPIPAMMAIMHQESRFVAQAQPKREWFLWVIPLPRQSSAFGYAKHKTLFGMNTPVMAIAFILVIIFRMLLILLVGICMEAAKH